MLNWLKKRLRTWLLDEGVSKKVGKFYVKLNDRIEAVEPVEVVGVFIRCSHETGEVMVTRRMAVDESQFDAILKRLGSGSFCCWEDGTPAEF